MGELQGLFVNEALGFLLVRSSAQYIDQLITVNWIELNKDCFLSESISLDERESSYTHVCKFSLYLLDGNKSKVGFNSHNSA